MNVFGHQSRDQLETAHQALQQIAQTVLIVKDHSILKGHRPQDEQDAAFNADPQRSKLKWPDGKHNGAPSLAIDVQTYPLPFADGASHTYDEYATALRGEQYYLLGLYVGVGETMGIKLRTGADWDADGEVSDNGWDDLFHVEIVED